MTRPDHIDRFFAGLLLVIVLVAVTVATEGVWKEVIGTELPIYIYTVIGFSFIFFCWFLGLLIIDGGLKFRRKLNRWL